MTVVGDARTYSGPSPRYFGTDCSKAFKHYILQACKGDCIIHINVNRRMLPGRALFYKYISNSEYFKHINVGIEVLRGRRYCKEVVL